MRPREFVTFGFGFERLVWSGLGVVVCVLHCKCNEAIWEVGGVVDPTFRERKKCCAFLSVRGGGWKKKRESAHFVSSRRLSELSGEREKRERAAEEKEEGRDVIK
jgi:hypothetical protein